MWLSPDSSGSQNDPIHPSRRRAQHRQLQKLSEDNEPREVDDQFCLSCGHMLFEQNGRRFCIMCRNRGRVT